MADVNATENIPAKPAIPALTTSDLAKAFKLTKRYGEYLEGWRDVYRRMSEKQRHIIESCRWYASRARTESDRQIPLN